MALTNMQPDSMSILFTCIFYFTSWDVP